MNEINSRHTKIAIIGSGPAGLTAAIYAGRALLDPVVIGGRALGGQLMTTTEVENFPGFPEGIQGPELIERMLEQSKRFGATVLGENVESIEISQRPFLIITENQKLTADAIILATGADAKWLGLESEDRLKGHGVSSCATCDGFFFRGKEIAVIGGGDSAMEEAIFLTRFASRVYIVHRRDEFRASKIMVEKAKANPKIQFKLSRVVEEILGQDQVAGIRFKHSQTNEEETLPVQGVFVAIGHVPNSRFFQGQIDVDDKGYVTVSNGHHSSVPGIFVAGDLHDHKYRQAITAAGAGCAAALEAERYLSHQE